MHEAETNTGQMTIGQFARRTRLSYKALRLYDSMGLLPPAFVDAQNGYRYYQEEQIEQARLIALLRRLEMPLERIGEVLALPRERASAAIAAYWEEQEIQVGNRRRLVRFLENYLEDRGGQMFDVKTRSVPEQRVVAIRGNVFAEELPRFIQNSMHRLYDYLAEAGAPPERHPFVAYHGQVDMDSDGPVEVCVPVGAPVEPTGDITVRSEAAHEQAFVRLTKAQVAFPGILEAYEAVERHLRDAGRRKVGSPREVYFADWGQAADGDEVCDIAFPYAG